MLSKHLNNAYRFMRKIIENDGHNHWSVDGTPHCNIRRDATSSIPSTELHLEPRTIINVETDNIRSAFR
jgi:hypothetical protein